MTCWFALSEFHKFYDIEAGYTNMCWLARSFAESVAESRPLVPGFSVAMLDDYNMIAMATELLAA